MSTKVGIEFMLNTQLNRQEATAQQRGLPPPSPEMPVPAGAERIALPPVEQLPDFPCDLTAAIGQRRSVREYAETPLSIEELTYLLWCTQGVHHSRRAATLRSVPSAGARHPFETFLLINRVDGLQPGLYRYLALSHELVVLQLDSSLTERVVAACANQRFIAKSGVTFFWVAVPHGPPGGMEVEVTVTSIWMPVTSARISIWPLKPSNAAAAPWPPSTTIGSTKCWVSTEKTPLSPMSHLWENALT